jgi:hypothetical protein
MDFVLYYMAFLLLIWILYLQPSAFASSALLWVLALQEWLHTSCLFPYDAALPLHRIFRTSFYIKERGPRHLWHAGARSTLILFRLRVRFGVRGCTLVTH